MENESMSLPLCGALVVFFISSLEGVSTGSEFLRVSKRVTAQKLNHDSMYIL